MTVTIGVNFERGDELFLIISFTKRNVAYKNPKLMRMVKALARMKLGPRGSVIRTQDLRRK
jgi:hypothetical protein